MCRLMRQRPAPSPLRGEGWGEGAILPGTPNYSPLTLTLSPGGRGNDLVAPAFEVHP